MKVNKVCELCKAAHVLHAIPVSTVKNYLDIFWEGLHPPQIKYLWVSCVICQQKSVQKSLNHNDTSMVVSQTGEHLDILCFA